MIRALLGPTRVHNPYGISVRSSINCTAHCILLVLYNCPQKKLPLFLGYSPTLILRLMAHTPKRHLNWFIRFLRTHDLCPTHTDTHTTDRPRNIGNNRPHLAIYVGLRLMPRYGLITTTINKTDNSVENPLSGHNDKHTNNGPIALTGPLKWLVNTKYVYALCIYIWWCRLSSCLPSEAGPF